MYYNDTTHKDGTPEIDYMSTDSNFYAEDSLKVLQYNIPIS